MTGGNALFLAVCLAEGGKTSKEFLARVHGVAEDHEETTDDGEVAEEEVEVEDEAIAECLNDDNAKKTANRVFRVPLRNDGSRTDEHSLRVHNGQG